MTSNPIINLPSTNQDYTTVFDIERVKTLDFNFDKYTEFKNEIQQIKEYFNSAYSQYEENKLNDESLYEKYWKPAKIELLNSIDSKYDVANKQYTNDFKTQVFENVFTLIHKSGRLYCFLSDDGKPITCSELKLCTDGELCTKDSALLENSSLKNLWDLIISKKLSTLSLALEQITSIPYDTNYYSHFFQFTEFIDFEIDVFREEYIRLESQLKFLNEVLDYVEKPKAIDKTTETKDFSLKAILEEKMDIFWINKDALASIKNTYTELKIQKANILRSIRQLQQRILEKGYYLFLKNIEDVYVAEGTSKDGKVEIKIGTDNLEHGKIYKIQDAQKIISISTLAYYKSKYGNGVFEKDGFVYIGESHTTGGRYGEHNDIIRYTKLGVAYTSQVKQYKSFELVNDSNDMLKNKLTELEKQKYSFHILNSYDGGYISNDGILLRNIMWNCEISEDYRKSCAILIPKYGYVITNQKYLLGYDIFINPLPPIISDKNPRIGIIENISYKIKWESTQFGELVDSINLAPGESRTINLSAKFSQATTSSESYKSITDTSMTSTNEFASEFQNEISKESVKTSSFSANASGNYLGMVSGGMSGSTSSKVTNFAKDLSKVAKKASTNISNKRSTEVNSSSILSTQINQESSRTTTVTNINQGRTLNLFIHKINNVYSTGIFLNNLRFICESKKQIVQNINIFETYTFDSLNFEELWKMVTDSLLFKGEKEEDRDAKKNEAKKDLLTKIIDDFNHEYFKDPNEKESANSIKPFELNKKVEKEDLDIKKIAEFFDNVSNKNPVNLFDDKLITASGAYFIDSIVGQNPATEKYSEDMRELEKRKIEKEVEKQHYENEQKRVKIGLLKTNTPFIESIHVLHEKKVEGEIEYQIKLKLNTKVEDKNWEVYFDGEKIINELETEDNKVIISGKWDSEKINISDLESKLFLTGEAGTFLKYL